MNALSMNLCQLRIPFNVLWTIGRIYHDDHNCEQGQTHKIIQIREKKLVSYLVK
jgi:hypothetical protein